MADGGVFLSTEDRPLLLKRSLDLIEACNVSKGIRSAYYRNIYSVIETGRQDGTKSKINLLWGHIDRLASHLFSPTALRALIDCENEYPKNILDQCRIAARILTRDWERTNTDTLFGSGVFEALRYGLCLLKQWPEAEGEDRVPVYRSSLVMPWNFGVTNEFNNTLERQDAMCETIMLTLPEVWRRIHHMPNAEQLFERIKTHASKSNIGDQQNSYLHTVFSTSPLSTGVQNMLRPVPGGIVQLNNDPNYSIMGPQIGVDVVKMYELWVRNGADYHTIQIIDPDVMIAPGPYTKLSNLLISGAEHSGLHPYTRICPNDVTGYFWGRSEVCDLIEPQSLISTWADDITRLFGLQIDKILAFMGDDGLNDEKYDQFRAAGYLNLDPNSKVQDLTPSFPPEAMQLLQFAMGLVNTIGGFDNIMSGQNQPGVRSAEQGETLKQMASPRLLDRSLLVERNCAQALDLRMSLHQAKDPNHYWTDPNNPEGTRFILADLPEDRRVSVDSHSGSPIFRSRHEQQVAFLLKAGVIDGESALELFDDIPMKDTLILRWKEKQAAQAALLKELQQRDPEGFTKLLEHQKSGRK